MRNSWQKITRGNENNRHLLPWSCDRVCIIIEENIRAISVEILRTYKSLLREKSSTWFSWNKSLREKKNIYLTIPGSRLARFSKEWEKRLLATFFRGKCTKELLKNSKCTSFLKKYLSKLVYEVFFHNVFPNCHYLRQYLPKYWRKLSLIKWFQSFS